MLGIETLNVAHIDRKTHHVAKDKNAWRDPRGISDAAIKKVLKSISKRKEISMTELTFKSNLHRTYIFKVLKVLVKEGKITRRKEVGASGALETFVGLIK